MFPHNKSLKSYLCKKSNYTSIPPWLDGIYLYIEKNVLKVHFIHCYFGNWFMTYKRTEFEKLIKKTLGHINIEYIIHAHNKINSNGLININISENKIVSTDNFINFIYNKKNLLAVEAAKNIANKDNPLSSFTLLFTGNSGVGKTHLLRATYLDLKERKIPTAFCSALNFLKHKFFSSDFINCYYSYQYIILDDLQAIFTDTICQNNLEQCLSEIPDTFGKMIFAMTGPASLLKNLNERLRLRIESGLIVELEEADLDVRLRWLEQKNRDRKLGFSKDHILFLARLGCQIPTLQGLLIKIEIFARIHNRMPTVEDLEEIAREGGQISSHGWRDILQAVSERLNLPIDEIMGQSRHPHLVLARQVAMYMCRRIIGFSYPELGRIFGGKDHSTVMHAIKKIEKLAVTDKDTRKLLTDLEIALKK